MNKIARKISISKCYQLLFDLCPIDNLFVLFSKAIFSLCVVIQIVSILIFTDIFILVQAHPCQCLNIVELCCIFSHRCSRCLLHSNFGQQQLFRIPNVKYCLFWLNWKKKKKLKKKLNSFTFILILYKYTCITQRLGHWVIV